jgi:hypothetical protein
MRALYCSMHGGKLEEQVVLAKKGEDKRGQTL